MVTLEVVSYFLKGTLSNGGGPAIMLSAMNLHPGDTAVFPVTLSSPAPNAVFVTLTSSDASIVSLSTALPSATANALVPAGGTTAIRVVAGKAGTVTITGTATGYAPATVQVAVAP